MFVNLPVDVYAVVVFGIDEAYELKKPYALRFEASVHSGQLTLRWSGPEILPILCKT